MCIIFIINGIISVTDEIFVLFTFHLSFLSSLNLNLEIKKRCSIRVSLA